MLLTASVYSLSTYLVVCTLIFAARAAQVSSADTVCFLTESTCEEMGYRALSESECLESYNTLGIPIKGIKPNSNAFITPKGCFASMDASSEWYAHYSRLPNREGPCSLINTCICGNCDKKRPSPADATLLGYATSPNPSLESFPTTFHLGIDQSTCTMHLTTMGNTEGTQYALQGDCLNANTTIEFKFKTNAVIAQTFVWHSFEDTIASGSSIMLTYANGIYTGQLVTSNRTFGVAMATSSMQINLDECLDSECSLASLTGFTPERKEHLVCDKTCDTSACGRDRGKCPDSRTFGVSIISSGTCESHDCVSITSAAECQAASSQVHIPGQLSPTTFGVELVSRKPPSCYIKYWAPDKTGLFSASVDRDVDMALCSSYRSCLCKECPAAALDSTKGPQSLLGTATTPNPKFSNLQVVFHISIEMVGGPCKLRLVTQGAQGNAAATGTVHEGECVIVSKTKMTFRFSSAVALTQDYIWYSFADSVRAGTQLELSWEEGTWHGFLETATHVFQVVLAPISFSADACVRGSSCTLEMLNAIDSSTGESTFECHSACNTEVCGFDNGKCTIDVSKYSPTRPPTRSPGKQDERKGNAKLNAGIAFVSIAIVVFGLLQYRLKSAPENDPPRGRHSSLGEAEPESVVPSSEHAPVTQSEEDEYNLSLA